MSFGSVQMRGLRDELRMCVDEGCVMGFGCVLMWLG